MQLSILIPVYNVALYLPALLQELFPNLSSNTEIIFYDDASSDNSIAIIEEYSRVYNNAQIQIVRGSENVGLTKAREYLLQASKAEYVWFIDSDDWVEAVALQKILSILSQNKPDVLMFDYDAFFDDSNKIKHSETLSFYPQNTLVKTSGKKIYRTAIRDGKHYFWNKIFRRNLIDNVVSYTIPAFEDIAYTPILLSKCQNFYYFTQIIVHYRIRKDSIAQKMSSMQLYGIKAYIQQAEYAEKVFGDSKSRAYLLYKTCMYFYRMLKKINRADLPLTNKNNFIYLSRSFYDDKKISEWKIVSLLIRAGMLTKAVKLINYIFIFKIKSSLKHHLSQN